MKMKKSPFALGTVLSALAMLVSIEVPATDGVITVQGSQVGSEVSLGGTVVPHKEVTLSAQTPGRIEFIAGEEGDQFEEKAELVSVDDTQLLAQRRAAVADFATAEAGLRNAGMQYSREVISPYGGQSNDAMGGMPSMFNFFSQPMRGMVPNGGNPGYERHADLYSHGTRVDQARSAIIAARSRIEEIDARLRDAKSIAPFSGVITKKMVEVGDSVQPGQPLLEYADTQFLQVRVEVPARLMPGLHVGQMIDARLDVGDSKIEVRVARIFPVADATRHTVTVKLDIPVGATAAPGMYAEVRIPDVNASERELPVVPNTALVYRGSLPGVFAIGANGKPELRLIRIGDPVSTDSVAVISGIDVGEQILASPPGAGR